MTSVNKKSNVPDVWTSAREWSEQAPMLEFWGGPGMFGGPHP